MKYTDQPPAMTDAQRKVFEETRYEAQREYILDDAHTVAHGPSFQAGWNTHASWQADKLREILEISRGEGKYASQSPHWRLGRIEGLLLGIPGAN